MTKYHNKLISCICLITALALPQIILAANPALNALDNIATGERGPYLPADSNTLNGIVGTVVGIALSLLGIIFLLLMLYAGYNWMTARGEEEKVTEAKSTIVRAVIGIVIVVGAYASWRFLFSKLF